MAANVMGEGNYLEKKYERPGLKPSEIEEIKVAFQLFDEGRQGLIDSKDVASALKSLGFDSSHERVYEKIDGHFQRAGRMEMTFVEFLDVIASNMNDKVTRQDVMKIFDVFDKDQNGKISLRNLKAVAKELGETLTDVELMEMLDRADTDRDGVVSPDEFYAIVTKTSYN